MGSKKKKQIDIILMSDNGLETVGGEQESTKIIINGIKNKFKIGVIQPGKIANPQSNVNYYNLTKRTRIKHLIKNPFAFISYINKVRKIITKEQPKIIHTQAQVSFFIVGLLRKIRLISKDIKLIHTERGLYTKYNNLFKRIFYFFMKELDTLVTTTKFNMKYWKKALTEKHIDVKYIVIENTAGELFEQFDPNLKRPADDSLVVGFAGRYADWKNWPLAVEISKKLNQKLGDKLKVKMAVGCLDTNAESETKKMFQKMTKLLGERFKGRINISLEEMDKFYYQIDVFILTSNYNTESFGRTLVEAMSRKTAVLTTDAGGSVEVVGGTENVCDKSEEFVRRIIDFFYNEEIMEKEKNINLTRVRKNYSLENNIVKHLDLYNFIFNKNQKTYPESRKD